MHKMSFVDELAELRAEIARLNLREARLSVLQAAGDTPALARASGRPGWPMQRGQKLPSLHLQ